MLAVWAMLAEAVKEAKTLKVGRGQHLRRRTGDGGRWINN
jgi:hypothetical protein